MPTFSELMRRKEELLLRLVPISVRQLEIVRQNDSTALLQHVGQKRRIMDEFEAVEQELVPYRDIPPEERKWKDEAEHLEIAAAVEHCNTMLEEILRNDNLSTEETAIQMQKIQTQLCGLRRGGNATTAYNKNR